MINNSEFKGTPLFGVEYVKNSTSHSKPDIFIIGTYVLFTDVISNDFD